MKRANPILISAATGGYHHWCPACDRLHPLPEKGWQFNGNFSRPLFTPSFKQIFVAILGRSISEPAEHSEHNITTELVCHYFITDGKIQFCPDSWHGRSDIVAMPPIPVDHGEDWA
jgi:Family of unknown function (DUF6527)